MKKQFITAYLCGTIVTAYTGYVLLDTFVLKDTYASEISDENISDVFASLQESAEESSTDNVPAEQDTSGSAQNEASSQSSSSQSYHHSRKKRSSSSEEASDSSEDTVSAPISETQVSSAGNTYSDENISISLSDYTVYDTVIYVADVTVSSAEYLKTAFAEDSYGKNITDETSDIAEAHNAVLAVNGDYYGARETGYVIRNGVVYRSECKAGTEILCIYADGTMKIWESDEKTAEELVEEGVWQAFTFGPALIEDSEISVSVSDEVGRSKASNPRTAIGIIDANHYIFVVSDGRTDESEGLSLYELAEFMKSLGATCAYNLDGGGSSTMYFMGEVINNPTTTGNSIKERSVSDIVYIG